MNGKPEVGNFTTITIRIALSYTRKRFFLFIYPFLETMGGIEVNPPELLIEGSLVVPVSEDVDEFVYELRI